MLNKKRGAIALSQILILLIGIIAISYAIGSSVKVVSGFYVPRTNPISNPFQNQITQLLNKISNTENPANKPTGEGAEEGFIASIFGIKKYGFTLDTLTSSAAYGISVGLGVKTVGTLLGMDENKVNSISKALGIGAFAGRGAFSLAKGGTLDFLKTSSGKFLGLTKNAATFGWGVGIATAIGIYLFTSKEESTKTVSFECLPWEAPLGGSDCEKCNNPDKPCSEYRCRSLGQTCELVNQGTEEERCVSVNPKDVKAPVITPWKEALLDGYKYSPDNTIQPPDAGVKIVNTKSTSGCVKAFTPLRFGITTNKPAQCKIDYNRPQIGKNEKASRGLFDSMQFYMGGSNLYRYNHTEVLSLPGPNASSSESPVLKNDGEYSLYVRCSDKLGNSNIQSFVFNFCVEKGPDTTPPTIVTTSILNNMPVSFNTTEVPLDVFTNEPADCKWSRNDLAYKDMENAMSCTSSIFEVNSNLLYKCSTTLTGLKNQQSNDFYFRCKDQPGADEKDRNVNSESFKFTLIGTKSLNIAGASPNGTIKDSTPVVPVTLKVKTTQGYKDGKSTCYYSNSGEDNFIEFRNTNTDDGLHNQQLNLPEGDYSYDIKCIDLGGNTATSIISFRVETDVSAPLVVRAFHEETKLKLITDEPATCVYDNVNCDFNFDEGIEFRNVNEVEHFADWDSGKTYYIKCKDSFGNEPAVTNTCSITLRPFDFLQN